MTEHPATGPAAPEPEPTSHKRSGKVLTTGVDALLAGFKASSEPTAAQKGTASDEEQPATTKSRARATKGAHQGSAPQDTAASPEGEDTPQPELPYFASLVRKECRFRDDQISDLQNLARRLKGARPKAAPPPPERVTDNTLIRIAVDVLLSHANELTGWDEASIAASAKNVFARTKH